MREFKTDDRHRAATLEAGFFDTARDMLCVAELSGRLVLVNPAWATIMGRRVEALQGACLVELTHPDDAGTAITAFDALAAGATGQRFDARMRDGAGVWRWLEFNAATQGDGFVHATVRDVTEARRDASHHAEIETHAGIGSWELDIDTLSMWWSPTTHAIHGTDPQSHVPDVESALAFYPPEPREALRAAVDSLVGEGAPFRMELPFCAGDGAARWVRITATAQMRIGRVVRVHGTFENITEQRQTHQALARLGEVAQRTTNLVVLTDTEGRITWVNNAFETVSGYTLAEATGHKPGALLQCADTDPETVARMRAAIGDCAPVRAEILNAAKCGTHYWLDIDIQPTRDAAGALTGFVSVQSDVTQRKALETAVKVERDRLTATLAALPDLLIELDAEGRYSGYHANDTNAFRIHPARFIGHMVEEALPSEAARVIRRAMAQTDRTGRAAGFELAIAGADGQRWFELSMAHRPADDPRDPPGYVFVARDITRRRTQQEALKLSKTLFKSLFDLAPIGIVLWDFDTGEYLHVNQAHLDTMGLDADARRGANLYELAREQGWHDDLCARARRLATTGASGPSEIEVPRGNGETATLLVRSKLTHGADGRRRVWAFVEDISARKAQEAELERLASAASQAHARLENAVEALPDGMAVYDDRARLVTSNSSFRALVPAGAEAMVPGATVESILRAELANGAHPEAAGRESEWLAEQLDAYRNAERRREYEITPGRWLRALDIDTADGGRVAVRIDITGSRRQYAALEAANDELTRSLAARDAAEERLARIIEGAQVGTWEWSLSSHRNEVNARWAEMLGYTVEELAPVTIHVWRALMHPEDLARVDAVLEPILSGREDDFEYELRLQHKRGHYVWVQSRGRVVRRADSGAPEVMAGVHLDITERKSLELEIEAERNRLREAVERAEAASRAKSEFLANMSHEIRTPLNGVTGMAEMLHDTVTDPEQRHMVATIRESSETLLTILNDILDMSKIESGKLVLEDAAFTPAELATKAEALHALRAAEKGLNFTVETDAPAQRCGDPHRLLQIMHNLIGNAIKFTEAGQVGLRLHGAAGRPLVIEVHDTGIGMTSAEVARIFDDFVQADGSVTRRYGGTGLGMSIVRRLIDMMGGDIAIESSPGVGTTVRITLPLPEAPAAAQPDAPPVDAGDAPAPCLDKLAGLRVLVADDNATNRAILRALLSGIGAQATLVNDGRAAIDAWAPERFDLLLLDISMPDIDGISALEAINATAHEHGACAPPAIAVSANAMRHQVEEYLAAGFDAHVAKPLSRAELLDEIRRLVEPA